MGECDAVCAVLSVLLNHHKYGTPLEREELVSRAAVEHEGDAKEAIDELKGVNEFSFVQVSNRGVMLINGRFGDLLDFLVLKCGRDPQELKWRCHHYEGWNQHSWWPPQE